MSLVVERTPVKNVKVNWNDYSQYMGNKKFMFQTTNQNVVSCSLASLYRSNITSYIVGPSMAGTPYRHDRHGMDGEIWDSIFRWDSAAGYVRGWYIKMFLVNFALSFACSKPWCLPKHRHVVTFALQTWRKTKIESLLERWLKFQVPSWKIFGV